MNRDDVAKVIHNNWADWMGFMFANCGTFNADGSWTMPTEQVWRLAGQAAAKFETPPMPKEQTDLFRASGNGTKGGLTTQERKSALAAADAFIATLQQLTDTDVEARK